ncbi:YbjQ family protein [Siminovitchia fortis]|uniref:YbjQ family protein n=1 Tax=Siminovitchia fortis TaxID=254758 RepID=UPI0011A6145B|nr:YbjQ family protein [Siminovitchia fortis]
MLIVTTENIANHKIIETKGPVFGITVRARGVGKDIVASFKGLLGGEISQYTEMLEDARKQAIDRMVENARLMGANAVTMMRFDSGEIGQNMSEIIAYGTAVVVEEA